MLLTQRSTVSRLGSKNKKVCCRAVMLAILEYDKRALSPFLFFLFFTQQLLLLLYYYYRVPVLCMYFCLGISILAVPFCGMTGRARKSQPLCLIHQPLFISIVASIEDGIRLECRLVSYHFPSASLCYES